MSNLPAWKIDAVMRLWAADVPLTEIIWRCSVSAPTVRKLAKANGVYPRASDHARKVAPKSGFAEELTPEQIEQGVADVQARWTPSQRRRADQYARTPRVRTFKASGYGLEEVA
jgi:hypothetical protein